MRTITPLNELGGVYDFLERHVRPRPGMYMHRESLQELEVILYGYGLALEIHEVDEQFAFHPRGEFTEWLWKRLGRTSPLGWATEIEREAHAEGASPVNMFFALLNDFRAEHAPATQNPPT